MIQKFKNGISQQEMSDLGIEEIRHVGDSWIVFFKSGGKERCRREKALLKFLNSLVD